MKKIENKNYVIIDIENDDFLNPIFIFLKNGGLIRRSKKDLKSMLNHPSNKFYYDIAKFCFSKGII